MPPSVKKSSPSSCGRLCLYLDMGLLLKRIGFMGMELFRGDIVWRQWAAGYGRTGTDPPSVRPGPTKTSTAIAMTEQRELNIPVILGCVLIMHLQVNALIKCSQYWIPAHGAIQPCSCVLQSIKMTIRKVHLSGLSY
jgi:hypothetical protein